MIMLPDKSFERTVAHGGRAVLAMDCVLGGAQWRRWPALQSLFKYKAWANEVLFSELGKLVDAPSRALAAIVLFLAAIPAFAEPVVHGPTGIVFPDEIAGFQRYRVDDEESKAPGAGFIYSYKTDEGARASIYVYTLGNVSQGDEDVEGPVMTRLREQTIKDIVAFAESQGERVRQSLKATIPVKTDAGDVNVLFDGFIVSAPGGARNTYLWLWSARGHFLKIRMTREAGGELDAEKLVEFYQTVVRLTATAKARSMTLSITPYPTEAEKTAWLAYALGLAKWIEEMKLKGTAPEGPFVPTFEAEVFARRNQIVVWREIIAKRPVPLAYMDAMLKVDDAGYLREYVWRHHHRASWGEPPADLKLPAFSQWASQNLRGHEPMTGAQAIFGPRQGESIQAR